MNKDLSDKQNKKVGYYKDTMWHKLLVIESALKLSNYLFNQGEIELGFKLLERANIHDNSKLLGTEFEKMSSIFGGTKSFTNPFLKLSVNEHMIIKEHWSKNRHHPEYFSDYSEMTEWFVIGLPGQNNIKLIFWNLFKHDKKQDLNFQMRCLKEFIFIV